MRIVSFSKGLIIAATTAFFMACGGGSPADKLMGHYEKTLSIIESNKGDLDKAATEIKSYVESNKADFKAQMEAMKAMGEELAKDPEKAAKMGMEMEKKKEELEKRQEALEKEVPGIKDHAGIKDAMAGFMM